MSEREETTTVQLKVRLDEDLRAQLEKACKQHGASLNSEVVHRLFYSFMEDKQLEHLFGRPEMYGLMAAVAAAMNLAGSTEIASTRQPAAAHWLEDGNAYDAAVRAATFILETMHPSRREYLLAEGAFSKAKHINLGLAASEQTLQRIRWRDSEYAEEARSILERLSERLRAESAK
jgi:hypothetical protein